MEGKINKQNDDFIVVFKDFTFKKVTKKQADKIIETSCTAKTTNIAIDDFFVALSFITKIQPAHEFYLQNPDKAPAPQYAPLPFASYQKLTPAQENKRRISRLERMIQGVQSFIDSQTGSSDKAKEIIAQMEKRITQNKLNF